MEFNLAPEDLYWLLQHTVSAPPEQGCHTAECGPWARHAAASNGFAQDARVVDDPAHRYPHGA